MCENEYMSFCLKKKKQQQHKHVVHTGIKYFMLTRAYHTAQTWKKRTKTKRTRYSKKAYNNNNNKLIVRAPIDSGIESISFVLRTFLVAGKHFWLSCMISLLQSCVLHQKFNSRNSFWIDGHKTTGCQYKSLASKIANRNVCYRIYIEHK